MADNRRYDSFSQFYPFYLAEHSDPRCRAMHYLGSTAVLVVTAFVVITGRWLWLLALPVIGYGCAWVGHFAFEKNRPATFRYPLYSLMGDWVMYRDFLTGRLAARHPAINDQNN